MKKVFLGGPMKGVDRKAALAWRKEATRLLSKKFKVLHALRGREKHETFSDSRAAVVRDLSDIKNSDILLVNDTTKNCSMIGTSMEVFFAHELKRPVIVFGDAHAGDYWLDYHSHMRVKDLRAACNVLNKMFS